VAPGAPVIGEVLGTVPDYVRRSLRSLGIAGFKIPQWEFYDGRVTPGAEYERLSVATYATHDHPPVRALWEDACEKSPEPDSDLMKIASFAGFDREIRNLDYEKDFYPTIIDALFNCESWITVVMITDLLARRYRFNVPGVAGHIGYALVFRIASGEMFGADQPINLHLIEIPAALGALDGVTMELHDCAFPLLQSVVPTADLDEGFRDINWALLVGSVPRKAGMERKDLLGINGKIFVGQGQAIERNASADVRVLVIGNPCNTNCLIAMNNAKEIPRDRWFAMTRLDENRAKAQLAHKAGVEVTAVTNMAIWGNHSSTQYP